MRFWPKTKDRGWYGPWDLMEDAAKAPKAIGKGLGKIPGVQSVASWAKDRGEDVEESRVGSAILSTSPSVGVSYGDAGLQGQAGLNRAQGGPSVNFGQGQGGQGGQENQGRDWGGTLMSLLPVLAQAGGSYLQYGREEKDRERMADAQAQANLVNLVAGSNVMSPQFTPSKVSGWEKLAKVGGQALQAGQQQRAQADQAKLRDLQIKAAQGNLTAQADAARLRGLQFGEQKALDAARSEFYGASPAEGADALEAWSPESAEEGARRHFDDIRAQDSPFDREEMQEWVKKNAADPMTGGIPQEWHPELTREELTAKYDADKADDIMTKRSLWASHYESGPGGARLQDWEIQNQVQPKDLPTISDINNKVDSWRKKEIAASPVDPTADFSPRQKGIYGQEMARLAEVQAKQGREERLYNLQVEAAQANIDLTNVRKDHQNALLTFPDTKAVLAVASAFGTIMPGLSEDEFFNSPAVMNAADNRAFTPAQKSAMFATYKTAALDRKIAMSSADQERVDKFHAKLIKEPTIRIRNDVRQAMTEMVSSFEVKGAPGLTDIQLMKLLARMQDPGSVVREAEYNTLAESIPVFDRAGIYIERFIEGDKLTEEGRQAIFKLGLEAYRNRMADVDRIASGYIESETMSQFGRSSPEYVQMFQIAANPFRLPEIEKEKLNKVLGHRERFWTPPGGTNLLGNLGKVNAAPSVPPPPAQGDAEAYLRQHERALDELDMPGITQGRETRNRIATSPYQW